MPFVTGRIRIRQVKNAQIRILTTICNQTYPAFNSSAVSQNDKSNKFCFNDSLLTGKIHGTLVEFCLFITDLDLLLYTCYNYMLNFSRLCQEEIIYLFLFKAACNGIAKVYTFNPAFRAEKGELLILGPVFFYLSMNCRVLC